MAGAQSQGSIWSIGVGSLLTLILMVACLGGAALAAPNASVHEGVASCAGSQCHARQAPTGMVVRQNEMITWQNPSGPSGSHSRAWQVLTESRGKMIAKRLGIGPAERAPQCLGCHADPAPAAQRGSLFQLSDGVGCESCHGGAGGWIASHKAVGGSHADSVSKGMIALENPKERANVCLDCHFGSDNPNQFVSHKIMAAGHPQIAFELDLFTEMQRHHDVDADYVARKRVAGGVQTWAVGQSMALNRALSVFVASSRTRGGAFPEFYFFDCHSCHRPISDGPVAALTVQPNPARGTATIDAPTFNDENMIMLSAAARTVSPDLAVQFEANSQALHLAIASDRAGVVPAAERLMKTTQRLTDAFSARTFSRKETRAILIDIADGAQTARFTDYSGGAQAVMAIDTLLNAMAASGQIGPDALKGLKIDISRAYRAVGDAKSYRPAEFKEALLRIGSKVRAL